MKIALIDKHLRLKVNNKRIKLSKHQQNDRVKGILDTFKQQKKINFNPHPAFNRDALIYFAKTIDEILAHFCSFKLAESLRILFTSIKERPRIRPPKFFKVFLLGKI